MLQEMDMRMHQGRGQSCLLHGVHGEVHGVNRGGILATVDAFSSEIHVDWQRNGINLVRIPANSCSWPPHKNAGSGRFGLWAPFGGCVSVWDGNFDGCCGMKLGHQFYPVTYLKSLGTYIKDSFVHHNWLDEI